MADFTMHGSSNPRLSNLKTRQASVSGRVSMFTEFLTIEYVGRGRDPDFSNLSLKIVF